MIKHGVPIGTEVLINTLGRPKGTEGIVRKHCGSSRPMYAVEIKNDNIPKNFYGNNIGPILEEFQFDVKLGYKEAESFMPKDMQDNVNHPKHYNNGKVECIEAMEAMAEGADVDTHAAYLWQNAFKYLWRWPYKNGKEDLKKAIWYINRLMERVDK